MAEYIWTAGARIKAKAQIVGQELEQLQDDHGGRLTARIVVEAARPVDAPLHPVFEWDDLRAAELYREDQARHVLHSIRLVERNERGQVLNNRIHAFVNLVETVGDDEQRGYISIARVLSDRDLLAQALRQAAAELRGFETRYADFEVIAEAARVAREHIEATLPASSAA